MASALSTPAILLRSTPYGEADRVVSLLGRSTGRLSALAKGARRSQRRFSGGLGVGAGGEAFLKERGGADLLLLESFDVQESRIGLGEDLAKTAHAAYALELCDRLCAPRHAEPEAFDWLDGFLRLLEAQGASSPRLRCFELGLLTRLGIGPVVEACAGCGRPEAAIGEEPARWVPSAGGLFCRDCARQGMLLLPLGRRGLARLARTALEAADALPWDRDVNTACREALFEILGLHLSQPLKSVEFIAKLGAG